MATVNVAVVGATGMVGRTFLKVLEQFKLPVANYTLLASARSAGKTIDFNGTKYTVAELTEQSFCNADKDAVNIALFSAGGDTSLKFAPIAAQNGWTVIDNSSAWRMKSDVPLVVPEVNPQDILWNKGIIANPNCSTIQAVTVLNPLHEAYTIQRIVYSTYQAVSGAGIKAVEDLHNESGTGLNKFLVPIRGNCIPHIDVFLDNGYTKEEQKMIDETHKIMGDDSFGVTATTVRVPVHTGHSESVNVEFEKDFDLEELKDILRKSDGIVVKDGNNVYPTAIDCVDHDEVYVGRIRRDFSVNSGVNLWIVADNLRKGAATNAVQIAARLIQYKEEGAL